MAITIFVRVLLGQLNTPCLVPRHSDPTSHPWIGRLSTDGTRTLARRRIINCSWRLSSPVFIDPPGSITLVRGANKTEGEPVVSDKGANPWAASRQPSRRKACLEDRGGASGGRRARGLTRRRGERFPPRRSRPQRARLSRATFRQRAIPPMTTLAVAPSRRCEARINKTRRWSHTHDLEVLQT